MTRIVPHRQGFVKAKTFALVLALAVAGALRPALAASAWSQAQGAAIRLIGGSTGPQGYEAGLEIRLDPGWKTYWRSPGDTGVPPVFDWSASENIAGVVVDWPAPHRFEDETGVSAGYKDSVVLPLLARPTDPARPARLVLTLDYAICRDICVPVHGGAALDLPVGAGPGEEAPRLDAARRAVPAPRPLGAAGDPAVTRIDLDRSVTPPHLTIKVAASPDAVLFAEGPDGWFLPAPARAGAVFTLSLDGAPKNVPLEGAHLLLTLVDGGRAVETAYTVPR